FPTRENAGFGSGSAIDRSNDDHFLVLVHAELHADSEQASFDLRALFIEGVAIEKARVWVVQTVEHRLDRFVRVVESFQLAVIAMFPAIPILTWIIFVVTDGGHELLLVIVLSDQTPGSLIKHLRHDGRRTSLSEQHRIRLVVRIAAVCNQNMGFGSS